MIARFWSWFLSVSLWFTSMGLMLASAGIDGAYLTKLMPVGWGWLGQVLNTTSDIASEVIMYWFGRLQMDASPVKRKRAKWLLVAEFVLVGFAWLFGWRQLLPILTQLEGENARWLAPLMAAFTPTALIAAGFAQALLAGRIEKSEPVTKSAQVAQPTSEPVQVADKPAQATDEIARIGEPRRIDINEWRAIAAGLDGQRANLDANRVNEILAARGLAQVPTSTARYWAKELK
jgi:hypothetical protein